MGTEIVVLIISIVNICCLYLVYKRVNLCEYRQRSLSLAQERFYENWWGYVRDLPLQLKPIENRITGLIKAMDVKVKVSEKLSDRAFSLASSANLGLMALQRTLAVRPSYYPKKQLIKNELGQQQVTETLVGVRKSDNVDYSQIDWLYPALDDEEREIVDKARELAEARKVGDKQ